MNIVLSAAKASQLDSELLAVAVLDEGEGKESKPIVKSGDAEINALASRLIDAKEITGKAGETTLALLPAGLGARRALFVGGGKADKFDALALGRMAGSAARAAKGKKLASFALQLPAVSAEFIRAAVEAIHVADFDANLHQSADKRTALRDATLLSPCCESLESFGDAVEEGRILGESLNFTRELVHQPGNYMTPTILGERARQMASAVGLEVEIEGPTQIQARKMGGFWSVAKGSSEEPRLIVLRYEPENAPKDVVLGLVGKGLTFDSGGVSLKPGANMDEMKTDMTGAATMIGAMRAIALLKPNVRVVCVCCACENMPDGSAQKPGDVQTAMNGVTIEVLNTDAEGRMVLADGLCYARELGATHLIDAATLTGACVVALGHEYTGVFGNNDDFAAQLMDAGKTAGDKLWRLPATEDYEELIKSDIADIKNTGGRWGGAITAALFLQHFVDDKPWIHLDIAGTATYEKPKPYAAKGPSGVAVRTLVELARKMAK